MSSANALTSHGSGTQAIPAKGCHFQPAEFPYFGSRRPDVVQVANPNLPLNDPNNYVICAYDFKFPGDRWGVGQKEAYRDIGNGNVREISLQECDWCGDEEKRKKAEKDYEAAKDPVRRQSPSSSRRPKSLGRRRGAAPVFL